ILVVGNHQVESDFAMARRAAGRHLRLLGAAAQFPGLMALAAAWLGFIPVTYATKEERAQSEAACVKYLGGKRKLLRLSRAEALVLSAVLLCATVAAIWFGFYLIAVLAGLALCFVAGMPGEDRA